MVEAIDYTQRLRALMQSADVSSYRMLAEKAGVSRWQVQQLRAGKASAMKVVALVALARALNLSLPSLLACFGVGSANSYQPQESQNRQELAQTKALQAEYERLQQQQAQQLKAAELSFQSESIRTLETWLTQWPTIAKRARERGADLPAEKILPFIRPIEALVASWGVEAIAPVDSQVPYDPQYHQLAGPSVDPGVAVAVTHSGATWRGNLLYRAKVKKT